MSKTIIAVVLSTFWMGAHAIDWRGIAIGAGQQSEYEKAQEVRAADLEAIRARTEYQKLQTQQLKQQQEEEEQRVLRNRHEAMLRQSAERQAAENLARQQKQDQIEQQRRDEVEYQRQQQARIDLERKQREQSLVVKSAPANRLVSKQEAARYRTAAEHGEAAAQTQLGYIYRDGRTVPKDEQQAYFWWLLASAEGEEEAIKERDAIESRLTPDQRAKAQTSARNWKPKK